MKYHIVLSGHDPVCCRSHSIRNLLLLNKVFNNLISGKSTVLIFVHPSEFTWLYRFFVRPFKSKHSIQFYRRFDPMLVSNNDTVISTYSTILENIDSSTVLLYDPSIPEKLAHLKEKHDWEIMP